MWVCGLTERRQMGKKREEAAAGKNDRLSSWAWGHGVRVSVLRQRRVCMDKGDLREPCTRSIEKFAMTAKKWS